ncbi:hypothetical protein [Sedimentitalea nanhaiensis]|uniref:Lipoprotein n=1 Tax=Sedimentitalea nanhaiensis TaxID=999627 RepID=A0A1I6YBF6_9RHOB|nr:hypothetical protein [Sedimentitalea nanhaiensis]SFT47687.1 hypothetical protein SAMN05216236_102128 [Sedimentitalea nanhaiensis]
MQRFCKTTAVLALLGGLAGCGDTVGEQALLGAGAGAGTAAVLNGSVLGGAALGAGANVLYCQENPGKC